jgi:hypothetical protein
MTLIVAFPGTQPQSDHASVAIVGGKGHSLIRMIGSGIPVPPGTILTTEFFVPWYEAVKRTESWREFVISSPDEWANRCDALKRVARDLKFTQQQHQALDFLGRTPTAETGDARFAVRSSSPDEDLQSASFAGGYDTTLGVRPPDLEAAIRHCFESSLDRRVFVYKGQHGFDLFSPRFAVIVQQQVDSDIAGIGFSLNPLTNDYDEAVINANWGLGESVVAGLASPDHFVVDKVTRQIIETTRGAKQVSHWLDGQTGTVARTGYRSADMTLDETQLATLTDMTCRIETLFEYPVDIEWAFAGGRLYVLQARPITTYVPLPPEMVTSPGERRRLYTDVGLSNGMTINAPISPLGLDWMADSVRAVFQHLCGTTRLKLTFDEGFMFFAGNRMYQDLSNMMWLVSPQKLAKASEPSDALMSATFANIDVTHYRAAQRPPWARLRMLGYLPRVLWRLRGFLGNTLWSLTAPRRARRSYQRKVEAFESELTTDVDDDLPLEQLRRDCLAHVAHGVFENTMPALAAGLFARRVIDTIVGKNEVDADGSSLIEKLKLGLTGNVVAEMGIALHQMAKLLDRDGLPNVAGTKNVVGPTGATKSASRIADRLMSTEFFAAWNAFLTQYGWRGPLEMDLANPRYADVP